MEIEKWMKIFEILIPTLTQEDQLDISGFNMSSSEVIDTFRKLGYEVDDWGENGWEQDTWYYLIKENCPTIAFCYSGFYGYKYLYLNED